MNERMDLLSARPYTDKNGEARTAFTRIGTAWQTTKGWSLTFDALPLPSMNDKGVVETRVLMMPPREPQQRGPAQADPDAPF